MSPVPWSSPEATPRRRRFRSEIAFALLDGPLWSAHRTVTRPDQHIGTWPRGAYSSKPLAQVVALYISYTPLSMRRRAHHPSLGRSQFFQAFLTHWTQRVLLTSHRARSFPFSLTPFSPHNPATLPPSPIRNSPFPTILLSSDSEVIP